MKTDPLVSFNFRVPRSLKEAVKKYREELERNGGRTTTLTEIALGHLYSNPRVTTLRKEGLAEVQKQASRARRRRKADTR